jgi:uncharacterized membrane protein
MPKRMVALIVCGLLLLSPPVALAQKSVVYAVLFFSPQCPHCHDVIDNYLPLWQQEFGARFKLLMVDVTTEQGGVLYWAATETPGIEFSSHGVPALVIANTVLIGTVDIAENVPNLVRDGLANGGVELPPIPGLTGAFTAELSEPTLIERLSADPIANGLAIGVLLVLLLSVGAVLIAYPQTTRRAWLQGRPAWIFALAASLAATGLASTLFLKSPGDSVLLTGGITGALLVVTIAIAMGRHSLNKASNGFSRLLPLAAFAGLAIAVYLSSIEVTQNEAFCGLVGNCNAVQQSPYARLFGVLPVGILGVLGYVGILVAWLITRIGHVHLSRLARAVLYGMVLFGVLFSIYLTFLEPFAIGATCIWCLTSAVIMLLLLWLTVLSAPQTVYSVPGQSAV